ncbi:hypothetical protein SAY87_003995 [Trapa incisa]|uniref:Uncharacterized protein n=1 Tax=Trapa incisa TaxID=236973 RepID=A0AAN7PLB1_9MYRT|nr:hypothetical protein SAY87_003995 [Trapa incisa]
MAATTTSTTCTTLFSFRSNSASSGSVHKDRGGGLPSCSRLDGVAAWLINGVGAAFFASLERFSCIRIATEDDSMEEGNSLIYNDGNLRPEGAGGGIDGMSRRRKGNKKGGANST